MLKDKTLFTLKNFIRTFPGILRDKTMDDKLKYITNDDKQGYYFSRFNLLG